MTHCKPTFRIWVEVERHDPEADSYENIDREEVGAFGATRDLTHTKAAELDGEHTLGEQTPANIQRACNHNLIGG